MEVMMNSKRYLGAKVGGQDLVGLLLDVAHFPINYVILSAASLADRERPFSPSATTKL